jgi:hypothetical protein
MSGFLTVYPLWVCLLCVLLAGLGWRACYPLTERRSSLWLVPGVLVGLALVPVLVAEERWGGAAAFVAGMSLGVALTRWVFRLEPARLVDGGVRLPASPGLVLIYVAYGAWVAYLVYVETPHRAPARLAHFYYVASGLVGLFSGLLVGRAAHLLALLRSAWARGRRR